MSESKSVGTQRFVPAQDASADQGIFLTTIDRTHITQETQSASVTPLALTVREKLGYGIGTFQVLFQDYLNYGF